MPADLISFARGAPSADILPAAAVREAAARALESDWERALTYGPGAGHPGLREWIGERIGVDAERTMVTNGSLEGAALLFEHLLQPGDRVAVEQPSYDRTLLLLGRRGVSLVPIPLHEDGLDVDALEDELGRGGLKLLHTIPNFHNPAGCTLSAEKRRQVVELASEHGFWIFEDDPYREVSFGGAALPTMLSLDDERRGPSGAAGRVIYASSFSKTVAPGVRVGYLAGPEPEIAGIAGRATDTYISPTMIAESIVLDLCRSGGLDETIAFVNRALAERRDALVDALRERLPEARFVVPGGGYFVWLTLGRDVDTEELLNGAREEGVAYVAGPDFMIDGGRSSLRLSFAGTRVERIDEGIARLARALERVGAASPA